MEANYATQNQAPYSSEPVDPLQEILTDLAGFAHKPYDFVLWAFPWGEAGTELATRVGPVGWQKRVLLDLQQEMLAGAKTPGEVVAALWAYAIRSGHDVGKSAFQCWIILWAMSTREDTRGRVTANTEKQLSRTLWPELSKWHQLFLAKDLFQHTATAYKARDPAKESTWRVDAIPWSEDNPEAFAGLHNFGKRIIILLDEASAIHDKIWETLDGVAIEGDTEIIWIATGNPTRNYGRFYECWHKFASMWKGFKVDSREMPFSNHAEIDKRIAAHGLESDYVKVRYLGEFPETAEAQLFPVSLVEAAGQRVAQSQPWEPLVLGVDVARQGKNASVALFRRGKDAKTIPRKRWHGMSTTQLGSAVAVLIDEYKPDAVFIDEGGVGGGVVDFLRHLGYSVIGIQFGSAASSSPGGVKVANKRAEMYYSTLIWLQQGGAIEPDPDLAEQLCAISYYIRKKTEDIVLLSKEDMAAEGLPSPDDADALVLTHAHPVSLQRSAKRGKGASAEYDPYSQAALMENA